MATFYDEPSRTFNEYLLIPGYSSKECIPANVSLRTPLVKFRRGEEPALSLNTPLTSAIMQSVSGEALAIALAREGGVSFIYGAQSVESEAAMVARGKREPGQRMETWEQPFAQWLEDQWQGVMSIINKAREARAAASDESVPF